MYEFILSIFLFSMLFISVFKIGKYVNKPQKPTRFYLWSVLIFVIVLYFVTGELIESI